MKKDIKERLRELSYDAIKEVAGDFDLDSGTKQRIYAKTIGKAGIKSPVTEKNTKYTKKTGGLKIDFKKPAVAAAAVVLTCSLGVGSIAAAGALNKSFGQYFNTLSEENYQTMLFDINQTQSKNGVTVTLTQGMCDGSTLYVIEKVEYDPSLVTLTDEMFDTSDGTLKAPFWETEIVSRTVGESYLGDLDRGFAKLLEHDEHSVTYLKTYDDDNALGYTRQFFRNGGKFGLTDSGLHNLTGTDEELYNCHFHFEFDIKLSDPVVYNLPEKTYRYDESIPFDGYEYYPDVWINPWYMRIAPAALTGKVLNTDLGSDKPALEITLNDGTVYSDGSGILVGGNPSEIKALFGKDYEKNTDIYCTFEQEIDVTNIKSIKLYGYEMTAGSVPEPKTRENPASVKQELEATNPVTFPQLETIFDVYELCNNGDRDRYSEWDEKVGHMKYKINAINVYDNLYATGAKYNDITPSRFEDGAYLFYDEKGEMSGKSFPQLCDTKTGALNENAYLVEYEIELTNMDIAHSDFRSEGFLNLEVYVNDKEGDGFNRVSFVYVKEHNSGDSTNFTLKKGETRTFHIGFVVPDNNAGSLEQIGLHFGGTTSTPLYVNITKAVEDLKKTK